MGKVRSREPKQKVIPLTRLTRRTTPSLTADLRSNKWYVLGIGSQCIALSLSLSLVAASSDVMPQNFLPGKIVTCFLIPLHWSSIPKTIRLFQPEVSQRLGVVTAGETHQRVDLALCWSLVYLSCLRPQKNLDFHFLVLGHIDLNTRKSGKNWPQHMVFPARVFFRIKNTVTELGGFSKFQRTSGNQLHNRRQTYWSQVYLQT